MSATFSLKNPNRPIRVGVILLDSITEILDVAPIDIFTALGTQFTEDVPEVFMPAEMKKQGMDFEFHWVSESGGAMQLTSGAKVNATHSFTNCPPLDIALMGAHIVEKYKMTDAEIAFIRKTYDDCSAFLTICAGMLPALQVGLIEGKTATAPREMLPMLREQAPGVNWVTKRWANGEKLWTSGTLLNGTDMMVAFVRHTWGKNCADGKPLTLVEHTIRGCGWPVRDIDYKDESL